MKNEQNITENVKSLFTEVVKAELSTYKLVSKNIVANTINHFASMTPFNILPIEQWYCICHNKGIKYTI